MYAILPSSRGADVGRNAISLFDTGVSGNFSAKHGPPTGAADEQHFVVTLVDGSQQSLGPFDK